MPSRAITSGSIGRFGRIDPTLGGDAQRQSLSFGWTRTRRRGPLTVDALAVRYDRNLFSNFTYLLDDAASGDQINQTDHRTLGGVNAELTTVRSVSGVAQLLCTGVPLRGDHIAVGLYRSAARVRGDTVRHDDIAQGSIGGYASLESQWRPRLRTVLGMRQDAYGFRVRSNDARNGGTRGAAITSPKASIILAPSRGTTILIDPLSGDSAARVIKRATSYHRVVVDIATRQRAALRTRRRDH